MRRWCDWLLSYLWEKRAYFLGDAEGFFLFFLFQSDAFGVDSGNLPAPKVWSQQNLLCICEKARERRNICHCDDIQVALFLLMISSSSTQSLQVKTWIILEINISSTCRELLPNSTQAHFSSLPPSFIQLFLFYFPTFVLLRCYVVAVAQMNCGCSSHTKVIGSCACHVKMSISRNMNLNCVTGCPG